MRLPRFGKDRLAPAHANGHHPPGSASPAPISFLDGGGPALAPRGVDARVLRGRAEFDSVFGDLAKGKRNWQLAFFGLLGVTLLLAIGLVTAATQSRITPYVVEVDRLGRAQAFGPAEQLVRTDHRVVTSQLAGFVRDLRTIAADPPVQAELVRHAYAFADQGAAAFLNAYFAAPANDPRLLGRQLTRIVEITSILPVPGRIAPDGLPSAWKVSWVETSLPRGMDAQATTTAWEGYFGTRIVPPTSAERLTVNPLGLYVTSVSWTQVAARATTTTTPASDPIASPPTAPPAATAAPGGY